MASYGPKVLVAPDIRPRPDARPDRCSESEVQAKRVLDLRHQTIRDRADSVSEAADRDRADLLGLGLRLAVRPADRGHGRVRRVGQDDAAARAAPGGASATTSDQSSSSSSITRMRAA